MELKQKNSSKKVFHYNDHWNKAKQPGSCGYHAFVLKNYFFILLWVYQKNRESRLLWVLLLAGLWLPVTIAVKILPSRQYIAYVGGTYSIIMWTLMAYVAFSIDKHEIVAETKSLSIAQKLRHVGVGCSNGAAHGDILKVHTLVLNHIICLNLVQLSL